MAMDPGSCDPAQLARLACLDLDDEERSLFAGQLRRMLQAFSPISDLPTDGVEPFAHPGDPLLTIREDQPAPGNRDGSCLSVPRLFGPHTGGER